MHETEEGTTRTRWGRGQRFQLSALGRAAAAAYRSGIVASRSEGGRASFDAARAAWAEHLQLEPADGLYLGELQAGPKTIEELVQALDGCGPQRTDVRDAVDRLVKLMMMEPVIPPPRPPPPPYSPRRW